MDKWADKILLENLGELDAVASVSSEEQANVIETGNSGDYSVMMDPIDGSSLIYIGLTVGTIVGIQRGLDPFKKGKDLAGAPSTFCMGL